MLNTLLISTKALYLCLHIVNYLNTYEGEEGITMAFANGEINRFQISQPISIVLTLSITKPKKNEKLLH